MFRQDSLVKFINSFFSKSFMNGVIVNFRGSHKQKHNLHIIIQLDKQNARKAIGKDVIWKSPAGKEIKGKIINIHGRNGAVRAIFERGLPGQALGQRVEIDVNA